MNPVSSQPEGGAVPLRTRILKAPGQPDGVVDRLVWPATAARTALYHGAEQQLLEAGGHFLMLDPCADAAARHLLGWLNSRGLRAG